jgi:hypothetical protein
MKERNVLRQRLLVEAIKRHRHLQIEDVSDAIAAFPSEPLHPQTKTYLNAALYLAFLAIWLEKKIEMELNHLTAMTNVSDFPGEANVDYRVAGCFGVIEGVTQLGEISSELISQSQRALCKAGLIALCEDEKRQLKAFDDSGADELSAAMLEATTPTIAKTKTLVSKCGLLTRFFEKRCKNALEIADVSVSSTYSTTGAMIIARALTLLAQVLERPFSAGAFDNDPHTDSNCLEDVQIGRAMAAGITADVVSAYIRKRITWVSVSLN